jgi:preprotein translocase subunit YajC
MSQSRARALMRRLGVLAVFAVLVLSSAACTTQSTSTTGGETTGTTEGSGGFLGNSGVMLIIWVAALGLLFYFLLIRPQRNRAKKDQELRSSMAVGDEVQTIGGIYGTIEYFDTETDTAVLQIEGGGKIRVARRALADKVRPKGK